MRRPASPPPTSALLACAALLAAVAAAGCRGGSDRPDHGPTDFRDFGVPPIATSAEPLAPASASSGPLPSRFGFGRPATAARIDSEDIDVEPDGTGLPPGRGTAAQGAAVYSLHCVKCHGPSGTGGSARPLVTEKSSRIRGFPFARIPFYLPTVGTYWPYASTLFDYVRKAMPQDAPGSLTDDQVYAVSAWILWRNDIISRDSVMDATTLPGVVMPARGRFVLDRRHGGPEVR
ncbi:MAG TPA: cytochrome c [Gemmatimonadota bacterium]|nr:cytochrome c [Gemmatimonadota bacterium]